MKQGFYCVKCVWLRWGCVVVGATRRTGHQVDGTRVLVVGPLLRFWAGWQICYTVALFVSRVLDVVERARGVEL